MMRSDFQEEQAREKSKLHSTSKELHPDRNPDADQASKEKYLKASEAYANLVDDRKRRAYDRTLEPASSSHTSTHGTASHQHWSHHADLNRRSRANYAWDLPRRPRATASPRPQSHTHTHPHRAHQYASGKAYHYPNARRTTANPNSADSRAETEYERYLAAEERVRKDSGFVRTLQVAGLITAVAAVAGFARG
ncbi:hypothetical protein FRC00_012097 [Tulasnella sp. 408]|nr:hypothetical protein FRC00_012097 [Tulasnella sp. 408]